MPHYDGTATHYEVLNIPRNSAQGLIKSAYRKKLREVHPDVLRTSEDTGQFLRVQEAYAVLSDPVKRKQYDETLPPESKEERRKKPLVGFLPFGCAPIIGLMLLLLVAALFLLPDQNNWLQKLFVSDQIDLTIESAAQGTVTAVTCDDSLRIKLSSRYEQSAFFVDRVNFNQVSQQCNGLFLTFYMTIETSTNSLYEAEDIIKCRKKVNNLAGNINRININSNFICQIQGTSKKIALGQINSKDVSDNVGGLAIEIG